MCAFSPWKSRELHVFVLEARKQVGHQAEIDADTGRVAVAELVVQNLADRERRGHGERRAASRALAIGVISAARVMSMRPTAMPKVA